MSKKVVENVCKWTNKRAQMYLEDKDSLKVYDINWREVYADEFYVFIALTLIMGIIKYPRTKDYWSRSFLFGGPRVFHIMSRNRYLSIMKFLRFSDPGAYAHGRPLTRITMFFALLREIYEAHRYR